MNWFARLSVLWRSVIIAFAGAVAVGAAVFGWVVLGPGPMDFAGGNRVLLADYREADPTGVPPELARAKNMMRPRSLLLLAEGAAVPAAAVPLALVRLSAEADASAGAAFATAAAAGARVDAGTDAGVGAEPSSWQWPMT